MFAQKWFDEMASRLREAYAASPAKDLEKNIRLVLSSAFAKLDLVTREEFDVQQEILVRTRARLAALEERLARLEEEVFASQHTSVGQTDYDQTSD